MRALMYSQAKKFPSLAPQNSNLRPPSLHSRKTSCGSVAHRSGFSAGHRDGADVLQNGNQRRRYTTSGKSAPPGAPPAAPNAFRRTQIKITKQKKRDLSVKHQAVVYAGTGRRRLLPAGATHLSVAVGGEPIIESIHRQPVARINGGGLPFRRPGALAAWRSRTM